MADERIVDVDAMFSKWHDLLGSAYPNLPCQTFPMFIRNNSQELVRCRDCWRHRTANCPMFLRGGDYAFHDGFCHLGAKDMDVPTKDGGAD